VDIVICGIIVLSARNRVKIYEDCC
jgi:hypothetical protein